MDTKKHTDRFPKYDVFRRTCPSQTVLDVLANKWAYLAISALRSGTQRFGELAYRIEGITPKMLTQTLRALEQDGLVERESFPTIPPKVEYTLTPLGTELVGLLDAILRWSERHVPEILKARERARRGSGDSNKPGDCEPRNAPPGGVVRPRVGP
jgi:DNA-binding HxlR family transcriptional regulator